MMHRMPPELKMLVEVDLKQNDFVSLIRTSRS